MSIVEREGAKRYSVALAVMKVWADPTGRKLVTFPVG